MESFNERQVILGAEQSAMSGEDMTEQVLRQTALRRLAEKSNSLSVSNFDPANDDDQFALLRSITAEQQVIWRVRPESIAVRYVLMREYEKTDNATGEIDQKTRIVLVDDDGTVWGTSSGVVGQIFNALLQNKRGRKRFDPPLRVRFKYPNGSSSGSIQPWIDDADLQVFYGKTDLV